MKSLKTVAAILLKNRKILLVKRNHQPFKGCWCLPGGHVDYGETSRQAVVREVNEETGLTFTPLFLEKSEEHFPTLKWHAHVSAYSGRAQGRIKKEKKEVQKARWFSEEEIKKLKIAFNHQRIIENYLVKHTL